MLARKAAVKFWLDTSLVNVMFDRRFSGDSAAFRPSCAAWICLAVLMSPALSAADEIEDVSHISPDTRRIFGRADRALKDLDGYLTAIKFQNSALIGTNFFGVSVGGIDAIKDLEEGRGVDPETLAALYGGFAIPAVAKHLNLQKVRDAQGNMTLKINAVDGRLRYKGAVVRLYSPEQLRELFDRREAFRTDNERTRKEVFNDYVYQRRRSVGNLDISGQANESQELSKRFLELQPLLGDLQAALQGEASATSIISGSTSQHFFGLSVGGINVEEDLIQRKTVDPETYAAIFAQRVSIDYSETLKFVDGRVLHEGKEVKLYSPTVLESYFRRRDRLSIRTADR